MVGNFNRGYFESSCVLKIGPDSAINVIKKQQKMVVTTNKL